jgi:S1-C subfamily serine protease
MRRLSLLLAALAAGVPISLARADDAASLEATADRVAPAIVTVKYVTKSEDAESQGEVSAATLDASGLVVLASSQLPGTPRSVKVLYGADPTEHDAVLVARDTSIGLAWVQPLDVGEKPPPSLELGKPAALRVGTPLFGVSRSPRAFDFAPMVQRAYVSAKIEKPRAMWGIAGDFSSVGLPVFDLAGALVGVLSTQGSEDDEEMGSGTKTCILPVDVVAKSLAQAKKRVPDAVAKAKAAKEEAPAEPAMGDAKPPPAPGDGKTEPGMGEPAMGDEPAMGAK